MSNMINNRLVMSGPDMKVIEEVIITLASHGMSYWLPMPAVLLNDTLYPLKDREPGWRVWAKYHWGCKWDMTNAETIEIGEDYGILHFNTANSSIEPFVDMLKQVFEDYEFDLEYRDVDDGVSELHSYTTRKDKK